MNYILVFVATAVISAIVLLVALRGAAEERIFIRVFKGKKEYYEVSEENPYGAPYKYRFPTRKIMIVYVITTIILSPGVYLVAGALVQSVTTGFLLGSCLTILHKIDAIETFTRHEKPEESASN